MFDLKERAEAEWASVPVPLPGRAMLFAGPGGVPMVRRSDGQVQDFKGGPGLGFKRAERLPAPALVPSLDFQVLFSVDVSGLDVGDLVEIEVPLDAVVAIPTALHLEISVDGGDWVGVFAGQQISARADVCVAVLVRGNDLRASVMATSGNGAMVMKSAALPAGQVVQARAKWLHVYGGALANVTAWPVRVRVS